MHQGVFETNLPSLKQFGKYDLKFQFFIFNKAGTDTDHTNAVSSIEEQIANESSALFATGRGWDDGIIDPRDTRTVLGIALSAAHGNTIQGASGFGVFRP